MRVAIASDIHGKYSNLHIPEADVLVLGGDLIPNFSSDKTKDALLQLSWIGKWHEWLDRMSDIFDHIIMTPGNHDKCFELYPLQSKSLVEYKSNIHLLIDEGIELDGKKFWGSPYTPWFHGYYWSFQLQPAINGFSQHAKDTWAKIPYELDCLITHGPPYGILDKCEDGRLVGCPQLQSAVLEKKPKVWCGGHIHEGYGEKIFNGTRFYNVSVCDLQYRPINPIRVIEI